MAKQKTNFFKSTLFKCLVSLLTIALVASGLLAILNDLLYVDDATRTARALKKIYDYDIYNYETVLEAEDESKMLKYNGDSYVDKVYVVDGATENDYDVLIHATGGQGYKNGTITLWIRVNVVESEQAGTKTTSEQIVTVIVDGYEKQTLMSRISKPFLERFCINITDKYEDIFTMKDESLKTPVTGATKSGNAVCNAVNCALEYMSSWGGRA